VKLSHDLGVRGARTFHGCVISRCNHVWIGGERVGKDHSALNSVPQCDLRGDGQCNGDFTVSRDATFPGTPGGSGIELGMRIEQRSAGQLNPPAHTQRDYTVQLRSDVTQPNPSRAWWNFQQSIAYDGLIDNLDALEFIIRTDAGTSIPSAPSFDMLAARSTIDDRNTNGTATYTDLYQPRRTQPLDTSRLTTGTRRAPGR
jgi:hypothetical protein